MCIVVFRPRPALYSRNTRPHAQHAIDNQSQLEAVERLTQHVKISILLDGRRHRITPINENENGTEGAQTTQRCRIRQIGMPKISDDEFDVTRRMNARTHDDLMRMSEHRLHSRGSATARVYECNPSH